MERRVSSMSTTASSLGDSEADARRSSSAICGVNYTGMGELERCVDLRLSYCKSRSIPRTVPEYDVDSVLQKLACRLGSFPRSCLLNDEALQLRARSL